MIQALALMKTLMEKRSEKELGNLIGKGASAEIYEWGKDQVLKLYFRDHPIEPIEREASNTHAIYSTGFRVPEAGNIVEINNRLGLPLERVDGISLSDIIY